jgi:hypothetical protein
MTALLRSVPARPTNGVSGRVALPLRSTVVAQRLVLVRGADLKGPVAADVDRHPRRSLAVSPVDRGDEIAVGGLLEVGPVIVAPRHDELLLPARDAVEGDGRQPTRGALSCRAGVRIHGSGVHVEDAVVVGLDPAQLIDDPHVAVPASPVIEHVLDGHGPVARPLGVAGPRGRLDLGNRLAVAPVDRGDRRSDSLAGIRVKPRQDAGPHLALIDVVGQQNAGLQRFKTRAEPGPARAGRRPRGAAKNGEQTGEHGSSLGWWRVDGFTRPAIWANRRVTH